MEKIQLFWFRRDLRLKDNHGLYRALKAGNVLPIFIFDTDILEALPKNDARVGFIYKQLKLLHEQLSEVGSGLLVKYGAVAQVFEELLATHQIAAVHTNIDYEPYAIARDKNIASFLQKQGIAFHTYKDQVIFHEDEILKADGKPYTVYTPYKNKWLAKLSEKDYKAHPSKAYLNNCYKIRLPLLELSELGFKPSAQVVHPIQDAYLDKYDQIRDFPALDQTSYASVHLRFGTISVRERVRLALETNATYLSELIWREFFMQILYHFPHTTTQAFKKPYAHLPWRHDEADFKKWCAGETGYPLVDAGMRQLNKTGYIHNRVRMVCASFLCKHLLIDWRWGEAYFAKKLLDFDLAANVGNWQWAASTGCDAVPYFRIFNPTTQIQKFDKDLKYIRTWVSDFDQLTYPQPMVDHKQARERCLHFFKTHLT
ncbi:MAG: DNA photolyase family protein [Flavobacteriaceae bacterium]|nr:DNA photolyase family protein [Flavobacteriaceae bacterium]